jgi:hypothetical protein
VLLCVPRLHRLAVDAQRAHRRAAPVEDQVDTACERDRQVEPARGVRLARVQVQLERVAQAAVLPRAPARELLGDAGLESGGGLRERGRHGRREQDQQRGAGSHAF